MAFFPSLSLHTPKVTTVSETIRFLTVLLQLLFSCCGNPGNHAGKSESLQSFLVLSIIPTLKTLITTVGQVPQHPSTYCSMNVALKFHIHSVHTQPMRMGRNQRCTCINICNPKSYNSSHTEMLSPVQQVSHSSLWGGGSCIYLQSSKWISHRNTARSTKVIKLNDFKMFLHLIQNFNLLSCCTNFHQELPLKQSALKSFSHILSLINKQRGCFWQKTFKTMHRSKEFSCLYIL